MQRALLAGVLVALACSCLGVFLVLRRFSLIGDGIAHVSFATIALGLLLNASPLAVSLPLVAGAALLILKLTEKGNVYGDAAIGLVSSFGLALGVMLASLAGGFNVDLFSYLFGNILTISSTEVALAILLTLLVLGLLFFFYHDLFALTFDEEYARVMGIKAKRLNQMLILLTAFTVILGIRVVGTMLVSSLIILPAVTALQMAKSFKAAILTASLLGMVSVLAGICISVVLNLPAGATIVLVNFVFFLLALLFRRLA
jgi:zinc transport system permease protein